MLLETSPKQLQRANPPNEQEEVGENVPSGASRRSGTTVLIRFWGF